MIETENEKPKRGRKKKQKAAAELPGQATILPSGNRYTGD